MEIKEALAVIEKFDLSACENREVALTKLDEPPYNLKARYEIKIRVIQQKRTEFVMQLEILYKKLNINAFSSSSDPAVVRLRNAISELSEAQDTICRVIERDFYLK